MPNSYHRYLVIKMNHSCFLLTCSEMHFVLFIKLVNKELIRGKCHRHCIHWACNLST
uniref:Uncharacterized protein n=1 Tax=Arundo donax TaxID=35708 RepID=A0A0A9B2M8_ARUDO